MVVGSRGVSASDLDQMLIGAEDIVQGTPRPALQDDRGAIRKARSCWVLDGKSLQR